MKKSIILDPVDIQQMMKNWTTVKRNQIYFKTLNFEIVTTICSSLEWPSREKKSVGSYQKANLFCIRPLGQKINNSFYKIRGRL